MRYHYEPNREYVEPIHGRDYPCDHPLYFRCTLYLIDGKGLGVVQQRFDPINKQIRWGEIDPWLIDDIFQNPGFRSFFDERAREADTDGLYPTVTVRQIMWALKMKPLPKKRWETVIDRRIL